jgi:Ketosteroid isomerase-related protein
MSAESERRSGNRATVEKAFGLLSQQRHKEIAELITDDIDFELPYGPGQKALAVRGSDRWIALNDATWPAFTRFSLAITNVYELADPDMLVVEYQSDGEVRATKKPYRNRYIGVFRFRGGRICAWREFHNPEITAIAMTP